MLPAQDKKESKELAPAVMEETAQAKSDFLVEDLIKKSMRTGTSTILMTSYFLCSMKYSIYYF